MDRLTLTLARVLTVTVPAEYRAIVGADTRTVREYVDTTGGRWRLCRTSQPFHCTACRRWRPAGPYYSAPPSAVCPSHFRVRHSRAARQEA